MPCIKQIFGGIFLLVLGGVNVAEGLNSDMGTDKDPGKVRYQFFVFSVP